MISLKQEEEEEADQHLQRSFFGCLRAQATSEHIAGLRQLSVDPEDDVRAFSPKVFSEKKASLMRLVSHNMEYDH
jgi:hypothetical protein